MTNGSLPGAYHTASSAEPRLPADATTVIPSCHKCSTAASTGLVAYPCGTDTDTDRFNTLMLYASAFEPTHCSPRSRSDSYAPPLSSATLTLITVASGA